MKLQHARFALLAILLVFGGATYRNQLDWGDDWAQYLDQSKWLLNSNLQKPVHYFVYQNSSALYAPPYYPWGWPILLALTSNLPPAAVVALFWMGFSAVLFELYRRKTNDVRTALAWTLVWVVSPWMLRFKWEWLSDLPFAFCTTALIFVVQRPNPSKRTLALIGLLTACAIALRPLGWAMVLAAVIVVLWQVLRKQPKSQFIGAVLVGGGVVELLLSVLPRASGHFASVYGPPWLVSGVLDRIVHYFGAWRYAWSAAHSWFHDFGLWMGTLAVLTVVATWTYSLLSLKSTDSKPGTSLVPNWFAGIYVCAVLLFPVQSQGFRYLLPLVPWLIVRKLPVRYSLALAFLVLFSYFPAWIRIFHEAREQSDRVVGPNSPSARELISEIQNQVPVQDTLNASRPRALAHLTHRWSVFAPNRMSVNNSHNEHQWWVTSVHWPASVVPNDAKLVWSNTEYALFQIQEAKYPIVH